VRDLALEVVALGAAADGRQRACVRHVGFGQELEKLHARSELQRRWNNVSRKRLLRVGIANDHRVAVLVHAFGEAALAFQEGGHSSVGGAWGLQLPLELLAPEEEELFAVFVDFGDQHWTADGAALVVEAEKIAG